jgi:hypothetical protein
LFVIPHDHFRIHENGGNPGQKLSSRFSIKKRQHWTVAQKWHKLPTSTVRFIYGSDFALWERHCVFLADYRYLGGGGMKVGLCNRRAVYLCIPHIGFEMHEAIFVKLSMYIVTPERI